MKPFKHRIPPYHGCINILFTQRRIVHIVAPIALLIVRWFGEQKTVVVTTVTAVAGVILTGHASHLWHVILSLGLLMCKFERTSDQLYS